MESLEFSILLLKTAFSCMVCDGDIDRENEIPRFEEFCASSEYFSSLNYKEIINNLIKEFNEKNTNFIKDYLIELQGGKYSKEKALNIIRIAFMMIYADNIVKYEELKFFKLIRVRLDITNEEIINHFPSNKPFLQTTNEDIILQMPDINQFLEEDIITKSFVDKITSQYFNAIELPQFDLISNDEKNG